MLFGTVCRTGSALPDQCPVDSLLLYATNAEPELNFDLASNEKVEADAESE
jgi:hypothetical protein